MTTDDSGDDFDPDEETGEESASLKPWDPNKIRVSTRQYSLRQVVDEIADGTIDLAPDFQRDFVWKARQKTLLIESILLGIPLPAFYFNANEDNAVQVVDGVQRLSTIRDFAGGAMILSGDLEYLKRFENVRFSGLEPTLRRRFQQTQIVVHVIEPTTPADVKYDIFKRINTGGSPLTAQEIRHCIGRTRSRATLKRLAGLAVFKKATGLRNARRMADRELVLRFLAFHLLLERRSWPKIYQGFRTLDEFLADATAALDDPLRVTDPKLEQLESAFETAMRNAIKVFGDHAFRKWPRDATRRAPLNKSLFESWAVALCALPRSEAAVHAPKIRNAARGAMTDDVEYIQSVTYGTGKNEQVFRRFTRSLAIVAESSR
jgi:hypothetical protein